MSMCTHVRVPETVKTKFFCIKEDFGMNPTSSESHSKPLFSHYIKPYIVVFKTHKKILRENTRFTRNNELNKEFFTKNPQVNIFLLGSFLALILKF